VRKLATAAAVSLVLASGGVRALGLGDIEMRSALNQPMNAEIRLTSVKPGELDGMIVQLASADAFNRAGIERNNALTSLRFTVDESGGVPVIRITSNKPVVEPFLNFLLEVDWPQGRMVREYTVLLDPPVFMTPSATERSTANDSPTIVDRGEEESLITPAPIERNPVAEGEDVSLDGLADTDDSVLLEGLADAGEEVQLDGLGDDAAVAAGEVISLDSLEEGSDATEIVGGEVVTLTDLNAPNTEATVEFTAEQQAQREAAVSEIPDVELVGSTDEISDNFVVEGSEQVVEGEPIEIEVGEIISLDDDAEIVSLDEESDVVSLDDESDVVSLDDAAEVVSLDEIDSEQSTGAAAGTQVTVKSGDTLFEIAQFNATDGVSVQQMMIALLNANQGAFINNNINLVRAGAVMRIPQSNEARALSQAQALAEIGNQNQLWQEYRDNLRTGAPTTVADAATDEGTPAASDSDAAGEEVALSEEAQSILDQAVQETLDGEELRIVADNEPTSTAASATADETDSGDTERLGEINRKLQLAKEELCSGDLTPERSCTT